MPLTSHNLSPFEWLIFLMHDNDLSLVCLNMNLAFLLQVAYNMFGGGDLLRRFRERRPGGDRLRLPESPYYSVAPVRIDAGPIAQPSRDYSLTKFRSSWVKNFADWRSAGIVSHAMIAMIIVAMPSKMNIQRQPDRLPMPSILMMTEARRPESAAATSRQRLNLERG